MKAERILACLLVAFLMILPCTTSAQERIRLGNLKIIPGLEGQTIYDDNIFLKSGSNDTTNKKVSDWIYHVKPSLLLNYTMPERGFVNLGYKGDWAFYNDNTANNWKSNAGFLAVDYKAPGGLIVGIDNLYTATEDPYGSPDQYNIGRITKRWNNDLKSRIGYLFSPSFRSFVYYNLYKQKYQSELDAAQDYIDNEVGLGLEAKFLPKTWGFIRYHYGTRDFFSDSINSSLKANSKWHRASGGLTWDPAAKLSGELNVGYIWKSYDNEATSTGIPRRNENTWAAATALTYKPFETTSIILNFGRTLRDTAADTGEAFRDTAVGLTFQQVMLRRFTFKVGGQYSRNDYNRNDRKDDNYQLNAGVEYKPREWVNFGLEYCFKEKSSNFGENDFKDNQVIASVKLVY